MKVLAKTLCAIDTNIEEMEHERKETLEAVASISAISAQTMASIADVSKIAEQQLHTMKDLSESERNLSKRAAFLTKAIAKFNM